MQDGNLLRSPDREVSGCRDYNGFFERAAVLCARISERRIWIAGNLVRLALPEGGELEEEASRRLRHQLDEPS
jgi:hypothetical protein